MADEQGHRAETGVGEGAYSTALQDSLLRRDREADGARRVHSVVAPAYNDGGTARRDLWPGTDRVAGGAGRSETGTAVLWQRRQLTKACCCANITPYA